MMNKKIAIALAGIGALFIANSAAAQTSPYVGAALGISDLDYPGYDKAGSLQLFGGMNLSQNFALEGAYSYLGQFDLSGFNNAYIEVDGFEFTAVGNLPIADNVALFGEAGLYFWNADGVVNGYTVASDDGTDLTYGFGVKAGLSRELTMNVEFQRYNDVSDVDIDTFYVGLAFNF